jgi:hypothetical protein
VLISTIVAESGKKSADERRRRVLKPSGEKKKAERKGREKSTTNR